MGGKKPRGSDPARGSSFSCRSRRGGDFRALSHELEAGTEKVTSSPEEFSLFSSLGVRELAPWLSDEKVSNYSDQTRTSSMDQRHSYSASHLNNIGR